MGIPIARVFGIEIRVTLGWAIVLAVVAVIAVGQLTTVDPTLPSHIAWLLGGIVALGFFLSSVTHDLAHALVARRRGVDVESILVSFFGGATPLDPSSPDPRHDAAIAASGPVASIGIALALLGLTAGATALGESFSAAVGVLAVLVFLNLVLGIVNLVPAYPLDGGRIVRDLAWRRSGSERSGMQAASRTGRLTGYVVIAAGLAVLLLEGGYTGAMLALTGWFLVLSANSLRDRVRLDDLVGGRTVADAMEKDPVTVTPALTVDTFASQLLDRGSSLTAVPVVHDDRIVGLLGVRQVRAMRPGDWTTTRVSDVMVEPPKLSFLAPDEPLKQALERIHRAGVDGLPVVEDGQLVGVLTRLSVGSYVKARQTSGGPG
ncbi:MAG TPA: site-2 protease family protein [Candidatus Limnocylindrales bacterium]|jgi:Zn-dependent protease/CBS domain-containing protein|nr:site-2 protease family protein [Candidatus Limnocylindrales bacterium]